MNTNNTYIYLALNKYENVGKGAQGFPFTFCGVFNDGINKHEIFLPEKGEILYEFLYSPETDIVKTDKEFLARTHQQKIPANVVVEKKPLDSGGG